MNAPGTGRLFPEQALSKDGEEDADMQHKPLTLSLKDGRSAILRCAEPDDAPALLECLRAIASETEFVLNYPEECTWTEEQERALLVGFARNPNQLFLVCCLEGSIVGSCNLELNAKLKTRHRASVAIALRRECWGLGIGTAMLEATLEAARARGIAQVELDYIEGNARGRALYDKLGFVQVAEHPDAVRLRDGSSRSLIFMVKKL